MSFFDDIASKAVGVGQSLFGDTVSVVQDGKTSSVVAVFYSDEVLVENTLNTELFCEFTTSTFTPVRGAEVTYKSVVYRISQVESLESIHRCILKKKA